MANVEQSSDWEGNTMVTVPHYISDEPECKERAPDFNELRNRVLYGRGDRGKAPSAML